MRFCIIIPHLDSDMKRLLLSTLWQGTLSACLMESGSPKLARPSECRF